MKPALSLVLASVVLFGHVGGAAARGATEPQGEAPTGLFVSPFGELFFSAEGEPWPVAAWFAGADADSDGRLTHEEFVADGRRYFTTLDTRQDDRLTPDEIAAYEVALAAARARMPTLPGGGPRAPGRRLQGFSSPQLGLAGSPSQQQRGRQRAPTGPLAYGSIAAAGFFNYPQPIKAADRDTNQTVTAEEWAQATDRWFLVLDVNRDGALTLEELPPTPLQQLMQRS